MIKGIKILENLSKGLFYIHKRLLYKTYIFPIALYRFQLWCYNLKLKLRLHLGKGLREVKGFIRSGKE